MAKMGKSPVTPTKLPKGHAPQVTGKGSVKHYSSSKPRPPFSKVLD